MKTYPDLKKSVALSLCLHAGVFGGVLALDEQGKIQSPELDQPYSDAIQPIDTMTTTRPVSETNRESIISMYGNEVSILLEGEINEETASKFAQDYKNANQGFAHDYYVTVSTNSIGGYVASGHNIANEIGNSQVPTRIFCTGQAASMAAIILITAPNTFSRDATNNCSLMLHAPYDRIESGDKTIHLKISNYNMAQELMRDAPDAQDLKVPYTIITEDGLTEAAYMDMSREQVAENLKSLRATTAEFVSSIAQNSYLTEQDVSALFEKGDVYFNAVESQFLGLIDHIENVEMDDINAITSQISVCGQHPEISLCNDADNGAPLLQF
jgi:ATP-dependent protease ClpP protease subunit